MAVKNINAVGKTYYVYSADGVKLQTKHLSCSNMNYTPIFGSASGDANLNIVKTTDYVGNRVYENGSLKRILIDGGYIEGGVFHYYLTDHLGNVRAVANSSGTVVQRNHYYPYGMAFAENTFAEQGKQPYKYNGKELDQLHGLNLYDYSARQMEPALGRFTTMDPMCEKYYDWSPYAYVANNPLKFVDPTGMMVDWYLNLYKGQIEHVLGSENLFDQAKISLAKDDAKIEDIENALTEKGYDFEKDPSVEGGYFVDTREQYQAWKMMQVFSPGNLAAVFGMSGEFGVAKGARAILPALGKGLAKGAKEGINVYKHSFKYADRVRTRGVQDPVSHNFPYGFDDAILSTNPILKNNGYKIFQKSGTMNGKNGVFEIGLTKDGIIDHRFFRPIK